MKGGDCSFLIVHPGPTIVVIGRQPRARTFRLICFGRKRHYRKDGSCVHTENVMGQLKPDIRKRTKVTPFGARDADRDGENP